MGVSAEGPRCPVTGQHTSLFALVDKQIYSWQALSHYIKDQGYKQRSDEVIQVGPDDKQIAFLQTDPMKQFIHKSRSFNLGVVVDLEDTGDDLARQMQMALQMLMRAEVQRMNQAEPARMQQLGDHAQHVFAALPAPPPRQEREEEEDE